MAYRVNEIKGFSRPWNYLEAEAFSILRLLYFSHIYPYLYYCSLVWLSKFPSLLIPLHSIRLKSAKVLQSTSHISVELMKIKDVHTLHLSFIAFQYFGGDIPSSFSGLLEIVRNIILYETRNQDNPLLQCAWTLVLYLLSGAPGTPFLWGFDGSVP